VSDALATAGGDDDDAEAGAIGGDADVTDADTPGCKVFPAPLFGLLGSVELFNPESLNNKYVPTYWHCMLGNGGSIMAGLNRICILSKYTVVLLICTTRYLT
jgi:hypothetical protein